MNSIGLADPVSALVQQSAVYVWPDTSLREIAETLERESIGLVLVQREGRAAGVVSERDLVRAIAEGADLDGDRASDVMTYDITFVDADDALHRVAELMIDGEVRHVAVHEGGNKTGVISMRDLLPVLLAELSRSRG
jgi:signal-transduction protein with cAMP-binding, CBS, and nucleotidyltransferase domain